MATETDALLPPHVTLLGQALTPLLHRLEGRLTDGMPASKPGGPITLFAELAQETLGQYGKSADKLEREVGRLNEVISPSTVPSAEVHRTAGRLELVLDELLSGYTVLRRLQPQRDYADGHALLLAALRHSLVEIRDWLRDTVETIADPAAAVKKRTLDKRGHVNLHLRLTAPPELEVLDDWVECQERDRSTWNGLVALIAGFALGGLFFGGDE